MLLHLNQRLRLLKTVGWHLDIEKKQVKGFLLHLQFAQKFVSIHVSFNVKAALHIVLLLSLIHIYTTMNGKYLDILKSGFFCDIIIMGNFRILK